METLAGFSVDEWQSFIRTVVENRGSLDLPHLTEPRPRQMLAYQWELRKRASNKFSDPERWLWTAQLLEQASDEYVAQMTASAFPPGQQVWDLCCGAGADAVALARRGPVTAVDRSEVACALTQANLGFHEHVASRSGCLATDTSMISGHSVDVIQHPVEQLAIGSDAWIHIDPDRRSDQNRTTHPDSFHPNLAFLAALIDRTAGGSIKLAPATAFAELKQLDEQVSSHSSRVQHGELRSRRIGIHFISRGGSVRQQRWWWNVPGYPARTTTVSKSLRSGAWYHWQVDSDNGDLFRETDIATAWGEIEGYIGDSDVAVRAAGLNGALACQIGAMRIGNSRGYLTRATIDESNRLVDWFAVREIMPFDRKKLKKYLRQLEIGTLEIKVRNHSVIPEKLREELKPQGPDAATLLITQCGRRAVAIVADRVEPAAK